jgi:hypothetical protein
MSRVKRQLCRPSLEILGIGFASTAIYTTSFQMGSQVRVHGTEGLAPELFSARF